jgi:hypothetical protein
LPGRDRYCPQHSDDANEDNDECSGVSHNNPKK